MDQSRFDEITRSLAGKQSRRSTLRTLGALAAAIAGVSGHGAAVAKGRCRPAGVVCGKNADCCTGPCVPAATGRKVCAPICERGLTRCADLCVDLNTDPQNCGSCGNVVETDRGESCCFGNVCSAQEFCFSLTATATATFTGTALVTGFCSATATATATGTFSNSVITSVT